MGSTFGRLETLLRGLQAQQRSVDVTSQNIANANTPGYSRQVARLATTPPYTVPAFNMPDQAGQVGTGVTVQSIDRLREGFLDLQYRMQSEQLGTTAARSGVYLQIEDVFNEPSTTGLSVSLDQFWQSWHDLANRPDDAATRTALIENVTALSTAINSARAQVEAVNGGVEQLVNSQVDQINQLAAQIAALNAQISGVLGAGQQPNDLLDARDQALDQLAQLVGTTAVTTPDGSINLYIAGHALVNRDHVTAIQSDIDGSGTIALTWSDDGAAVAASAGSLAGLVQMHDQVIPAVLNDLASLRDTLAQQVNAVHETGYGLNDPAGPPPARDFFEVLPNGDLRVNPALAADPSLIATSSAAQTPGNADVATAIANLSDALTMSSGTSTINGFYRTLLARIGGESQRAGATQANQEAMVHTIDRRRQEVSSVSLDEEATNLVKFQHAYQAAARAMTVVDEMLDKLINGTGLVGR